VYFLNGVLNYLFMSGFFM